MTYTSPVDLSQHIDELFGTLLSDRRRAPETGPWKPSADISESKDAYTVSVDLPGVAKEDIKISVKEHVLTISGMRKAVTMEASKQLHRERLSGSFARTFRLSELVNTGGIDATFANGVLTLVVPKQEQAKPREIPIS